MGSLRLEDHSGEVIARMRLNAGAALAAMGQTAVGLVAGRIAGGYGRPIRRTGALLGSVAFQRGEGSVDVGSALPYAALVHEGTSRMPGRPFISDALLGGGEALQKAAAQRLKEGF